MAPQFNPRSSDFHRDPWTVYRHLRSEAPVYRQEELGFWALSRFDDVRNALYDWETYSNEGGVVVGEGSFFKPFLLIMDPPRHTQLRRLMVDILTPKRFLELEPAVRARARSLLQPARRDGRIDLAADFAARLPMSIIGRLLGIPEEMDAQFIEWGHAIGNIDPEGGAEDGRRAVEAIQKIYAWYDRCFDQRLAAPGRDDVIGRIVALEQRGELSRDEAIGFGFLITIAGSETTTRLIGNTLALLEAHPQQKAALLADSTLVQGALEETLRYDSPTYLETRTLKRDVELHGQHMRAGDQVALLFNAANHDEGHFENPDTFDIMRELGPADHLAFGGGVHACIGVQLARMEGRVAFEEIIAALGSYTLDMADAQHTYSTNQRGWLRLPAQVGEAVAT
ncbi:MAG: cytochrome P450 [Halioglobus sp.]|nr:cytochrome P450 [Halioglobus sp.]